ncbi:inovirus Gp2 family protein [Pseudomonas monteilii]|uniref:Inovirus Gp2 family protein n=2 Tax=Pseudomonas monteilii TaxID=76759 RepID=A0A7X3JTH5_9PSED|nr:inovirus Gp2 family protein [Pseudomonas monteilii]
MFLRVINIVVVNSHLCIGKLFMEQAEFLEAYKDKAFEHYYDESDGQCRSSYNQGMLFEFVSRIMRAVDVLRRPGGLFLPRKTKGVNSLVLSESEQRILSAISMNYVDLEKEVILFKVNPYIKVFIDCHGEIKPSNPYLLKGDAINDSIAILNKFVAVVREKISSSEFRRNMAAHTRAADKNYAGLTRYINDLFAKYSRLLVLRLDFSYRKGEFDIEDLSRPNDRREALISVTDDLVRHRIELLNHLKYKCPGLEMVGYVWKLEYGREKGHHYHMMFFLDGAKVRQDVVIAKRIGECWVTHVTKGKGIYYNCNRNKEGYRFCGVGMISHSDSQMIANLKEKAALYLTKVDHFVSACMPCGRRTFGKGNSPKHDSVVGRPRKSYPV